MLTTVSVLYDGVHIHGNIYVEANIVCQVFPPLPPTSWLCLKIGQHCPLSYAGQNNIWQFAIQQTIHTEGIWIFCP